MEKIRLLRNILIILAIIVGILYICLNFKDWFIHPVFSEKAKTRHVIVISVDALNVRDIDYIKTLPNFNSLMEEGSYAREVVGIYPSLTYPCHTSVITGVYPDRHGIIDNELFKPGVEEAEWYWFRKYIKVPTLYDIAKKSKMKVGALLWPVTGKADIDYNLPEIKARADQNQTWVVLSNGSPLFLLDIERRYGKMRNGIHQPELDNFVTASAKYLIKSKKPNLLLIHLTDLDEHRHRYGVMSDEAKESLKRQDTRIGEIIQAVKNAGIYDETTFVVIGDHGFIDIQYNININVQFKKEGLITADENNKLKDWKAIVQSCSGSAYIYLKNKDDLNTRITVENFLNSLKNAENSGISAIYKKDETDKMRVGMEADFMVEAKEGYAFTNNWDGSVISEILPGNKKVWGKVTVATHGYLPTKPDYSTLFIAAGSGIKKGVVIPIINIVDEGPTMAALLGLDMPDTDGRILEEILN